MTIDLHRDAKGNHSGGGIFILGGGGGDPIEEDDVSEDERKGNGEERDESIDVGVGSKRISRRSVSVSHVKC